MRRPVLIFLAALGMTAQAAAAQTGAVQIATDDCGPARLAIASPARPADDLARDPLRNPADVLCFFGIGEDDRVLDLFSGSGYYTEIISRLVGSSGKVSAHNNAAYLEFQKEEIAARYKDDRLANVDQLHAEANDLEFADNTFDAALMILAYHDIYYVSEDGSWPTIDGPRLLAEIKNGLKPGGILGIVDHIAEEGSPASTGTSLHRIDPALLKREVEAAGFIFDGESNALRHAEDDHTRPMYDPAVRGKTDRIIYRFHKPE